jgi:proteasome lid subunit RPN8/RPN11
MSQRYGFLKSQLEREIQDAVDRAEDLQEICGLLFDNGEYLDLVRCTNVSKSPASFELSPAQVERIVRERRSKGRQLVGTFHSHVASEAKPGKSDIRCALGALMLIIDVCDESGRLWRICEGQAEELKLTLLDG